MNNAIEITDLSKSYRLYERNVFDRFKDTFLPGSKERYKEFKALENINLQIKQGEVLGIIGRNGAGKSTLLKIISGITTPTSGTIKVDGRIVALLELGSGFNPEYTGRENIYFTCALQGMSKEAIDLVYQDIVEFAEMEDFIDVPVKKYSSGMRARLGFATSINIDPDILILDEVLSVGDELFQRKCFVRIKALFDSGKTVIYVSHSLSSVKQLCNRVLLLHKGELLISGEPELVVDQYHRLMNESKDSGQVKDLVNKIKVLDKDKKKKSLRENAYKDRNLNNRIVNNKLELKSTNSHFVEGFESKSKQIIKEKNIDINNYSITSKDGKKVNQLKWGELHNIQFTVSFNVDVENVRIGVVIYNEKNIDISESFIPEPLNPIPVIKSGEIREFSTSFFAYMSSGLHAVRFVVRSLGDKGEYPVSIVSDAIIFRCIDSNPQASLVNFFQESEISLVKELNKGKKSVV